MNAYTAAWLCWIAFGAALEAKALADKRPGDTLSEHVWKWLRVRDSRAPAWAFAARFLILGGCVWLGLHFAFGLV